MCGVQMMCFGFSRWHPTHTSFCCHYASTLAGIKTLGIIINQKIKIMKKMQIFKKDNFTLVTNSIKGAK